MKIFSLLFDEAIEGLDFQFHPKCQSLGISYLIFADDLFLFSDTNLGSFNIMKSILKEFSDLSGLSPNLHKSEIFLSDVNE